VLSVLSVVKKIFTTESTAALNEPSYLNPLKSKAENKAPPPCGSGADV
jgi:hypothetical protein